MSGGGATSLIGARSGVGEWATGPGVGAAGALVAGLRRTLSGVPCRGPATVLALAACTASTGCAVGPSFRPEPAVSESERIGVSVPDTMRSFFDSLAEARARDTLTTAAAPRSLPPLALSTESLENLAWLQVLQDSTLQRLVRLALRQNRSLEAARARIREYRADAGAAWAALWPSLSVDGSLSRNQVAFGNLSIPAYTAWRVTADVAWELDFWGGTRRGIEAANADVAAQQAAERATVLSLVADVATGYLQLLELDQEERIARGTLATRETTLALARQRYESGVIAELDVRQFEAQVAVPAARIAQVQQLRANQEHALNVLLGQGPTAIPRTSTLAEAVRTVTVPDSIPASLVVRRPDVQRARHVYAAATARVGVADAARLPAFSITGSYGSQSQRVGNLFSTNAEVYQILFGVSAPIFTWGKLTNQTRAAAARAEQARAGYEAAVLTAVADAGNALAGLRAARDQLAANETQATALRQALDLAEARYRNGVSSYLDVLDAQRSLFSAELAVSQSELQLLGAAVTLFKALGGSWPGEGTG